MADLLDYIEKWQLIVDKAFSDYHLLTPQELVWFNVQSLIQAMGDGGLISYYYNSGADTMEDCLHSLEILKEYDVIDLIHRVNRFFPGGVPDNVDERNEIIDSWPDDGSICKILDQIEGDADKLLSKLKDTLVKYIEANGLGV